MTSNELRSLFPSVEKCIHLNHAGTSPIARPVADAIQTVCDELMSEDSVTAYLNHNTRQETLRATLARLMNIDPKTLAFVRNTSHAITIAAQAIPFRQGDTVVIPALEYPANIYPWMAQQHRGVAVRLVPPRENGIVSEEDITIACDGSTRVLAVSWVQWTTGQRLDLAYLSAFCRERGILLAVDIVQGLGALQIDLSTIQVDFASFGCHKWLLAPGGLGGLYVREQIFPVLLPTNIGWNSVEQAVDWDHLHYDRLRRTPRRFEEGTPSILATAALHKSLELLEAVGFDTVEDRILSLAQYAHQLLKKRGLPVFTPTEREKRSGIVGFRHPHLPHEEVLSALQAKKIVAVERGGNLRFSPHVYNTEADMETAVAAIPK